MFPPGHGSETFHLGQGELAYTSALGDAVRIEVGGGFAEIEQGAVAVLAPSADHRPEAQVEASRTTCSVSSPAPGRPRFSWIAGRLAVEPASGTRHSSRGDRREKRAASPRLHLYGTVFAAYRPTPAADLGVPGRSVSGDFVKKQDSRSETLSLLLYCSTVSLPG